MMEWGSWVLASLGIFGLYLTGEKKAAGFVVGAGVQILWIIFAVTTGQYGFILSAIGFGFFNLLNLYKWTRPKKEV